MQTACDLTLERGYCPSGQRTLIYRHDRQWEVIAVARSRMETVGVVGPGQLLLGPNTLFDVVSGPEFVPFPAVAGGHLYQAGKEVFAKAGRHMCGKKTC